MVMASMVRAQSLRGYPELVRDLGGSPGRLLRKVGVEPEVLNQLTGFIRFETLVDLLERSATDLRCPDFGLRLAERQDIGILGTLAVAMRYSATVGEALASASRYLHVYNAAIAFTIDTSERGDQARLELTALVEHAPRWTQTVEHGIGLAWRITTLLSEGRCHLRWVWFPHAAAGTAESYRARFEAPITFEAGTAALALLGRDLRLPISEHNQELHDVATAYLDGELAGVQNPIAVQVRKAIETLLGTGACSYRQVASVLYMHPRTLQRRLREEGTTFEDIKDEARRDLAQRYLSQPDVSLTQVSHFLDYKEQSALGRSCRRWFHATPRTLREQLTEHPPVPALA